MPRTRGPAWNDALAMEQQGSWRRIAWTADGLLRTIMDQALAVASWNLRPLTGEELQRKPLT